MAEEPGAVETPANPASVETPANPASAEAEVNLNTPVETPAAPPDFKSVIPEGFKDKPYLSDVENFEQLFTKLDGAQQLIGKRQVPADDAAKEEWDKYYEQQGRPAKAEDYKRAELKLPEGYEQNEELTKELMAGVHKAGLSQRQFQILEPIYNDVMLKAIQAADSKSAQADVKFDELKDKHFKDRGDQVMANGKALLQRFAPEGFGELIAQLPNEQLILFAGVLDGIASKYMTEDDLKGGGSPTVDGMSMEERRAEARKLMASPAYNDAFHPEHEATKKKIADLYAPLRGKK